VPEILNKDRILFANTVLEQFSPMSAVGGDAAIAVDVDQDALVLREEESLGASETSPLLPGSEAVDEEPALDDNLNKPWLGSPEFDAKPWWRRPNVCHSSMFLDRI
jgi:hypothetical protein